MRILPAPAFGAAAELSVRMLIDLASRHPADAVEAAVPDTDAAAALLLSRRPELLSWLGHWQQDLLERFGPAIADDASRALAALRIALTRMGLRHGSWGHDFHAYHNENHALELMDGRLTRLVQHADALLDGRNRIALALFSACHDLRQRESGQADAPVGANEAASVAESVRILTASGFDPQRDAWLYRTLELAIAGSTFDARPLPEDRNPRGRSVPGEKPPARGQFLDEPQARSGTGREAARKWTAPGTSQPGQSSAMHAPCSNTAELAARGGSLAPHLADWLDAQQPDWRTDAITVQALHLAQMASDLDTANVAEPLLELAASSIRLCEEREMRAGRALTSPESAAPCLSFLTDGQERYFFELHRFCSDAGRRAFAEGKDANAQPLRALVTAMRNDFPAGPAPQQCGLHLIRHFARLALRYSD